MKKRIDVLLVERGLVPSRERAQALIMAGHVLVADVPVTKPGSNVAEDAEVRIRGQDHPWVSRGGIKLDKALREFQIKAAGRIALDVGASTGGFTQVLLENGATRIFAVDVGHSQLDWKIRSDPRVVVFENLNARALQRAQLPGAPDAFGLIVMDVSFISVTKILPALIAFADRTTDWIVLIKPQFEVGRENVGKGGLVESEEARQKAVHDVQAAADSFGLHSVSLIESPITGTDGNREYLVHLRLQ